MRIRDTKYHILQLQAVNIIRILLSAQISQGKNLRLVPDKVIFVVISCWRQFYVYRNISHLSAIEVGNVSVARELLLNLTQVLPVMQFWLSFTICFQEQLKSAKGKEGDSAIHIAARKGDNDLVKLFIEAGSRVDTQNVIFLE